MVFFVLSVCRERLKGYVGGVASPMVDSLFVPSYVVASGVRWGFPSRGSGLPDLALRENVGSGASGARCVVMMLLCFANRLSGEPVLVSGGELVVVVEASFELG